MNARKTVFVTAAIAVIGLTGGTIVALNRGKPVDSGEKRSFVAVEQSPQAIAEAKQATDKPVEAPVQEASPVPAAESPAQAPVAEQPAPSIMDEAKTRVIQNLLARKTDATENDKRLQWYCFEQLITNYSDVNDRASVMGLVEQKQNMYFYSPCQSMEVSRQTP